MTDPGPTILVPKPSDAKYGFLSVYGIYPFTIDEKIWPSVSHFMLAKQFEGTLLEDDIRQAKNITIAKLMAKQRCCIIREEGRLVKKTVYGLNTQLGYQMRTDWSDPNIRIWYLETGTRAKFDQNLRLKRRLIETDGLSIIDQEFPENGDILTKIRKDYVDAIDEERSNRSKTKKFTSFGLPPIDIKSEVLTENEDLLVEKIIIIAGWLREMEGLASSDPRMIEDAIFNIVPPEIGTELLRAIQSWLELIFPEWSLMITKTPKFENLVTLLEKRLTNHRLPSFTKNDNLLSAIRIAIFIRWWRVDANGMANAILEKVKKLRKTHIFIPPIPRPYRKQMPLYVFKRQTKHREKTRIFSLKELMASTSTHNIKMTESSKGLILRGESLSKYRPQLLAIGGRSKDSATIEVPRRAQKKVEEIFFNDLRKESRIKAAYLGWWHQRIEMLVDTAQQISRLVSSKNITSKIMRLTIYNIYTFPSRDFTPSSTLVPDQKTIQSFKLNTKVLEVLRHVGTLSLECTSNLKDDLTYTDYYKIFDKDCGWSRPKSNTILSRIFTEEQVLIFSSIHNIVDAVTNPQHGFAYPLSMESASWAFLTLCPRCIRKDATSFLKSALKGWSTGDVGKAEEYLSSLKIYSKLRDIEKIFPDPPEVLMMMGIALTFIESRRKIFKERLSLMGSRKSNNTPQELEIEIPEHTPEIEPPPKIEEEMPLGEIKETAKGRVIDAADQDLFKFSDAKWILVIANATSTQPPIPKTPSENITKKVYDMYPYSNVYLSKNLVRHVGDSIISVPKDDATGIDLESTISHRYVISLIAENSEGGPKKIEDTSDHRKTWFSNSLKSLTKIIDREDSIAVAADILSPNYREIIDNFASTNGYTFYILSVAKDVKKRKRSQKIKPSFTGEVTPIISPSVLQDDISRGTLYVELFSPHNLSETDYSKLITHLERCTPHTRKIWIENFVASTLEKRKIELKNVLGIIE